ncbi:MAG: hypothetical protein A2070_06905 [Bdellovibrionales bacterium GWC1_52_8]|nr:MAG: hypothetical protein A2070_06905 [Bdellovibrionales bacterium GWC1_52_8]
MSAGTVIFIGINIPVHILAVDQLTECVVLVLALFATLSLDLFHSPLRIEGEEDLLALPAILFAPLGALVIYGHWQLGVVGVEVTEKTKDRAKSILNRFKI